MCKFLAALSICFGAKLINVIFAGAFFFVGIVRHIFGAALIRREQVARISIDTNERVFLVIPL